MERARKSYKKLKKTTTGAFKKLGLKKNIESAERHFEVIKKFGRFPHRNIVLNRISSLKEIEFLKTPGSKF